MDLIAQESVVHINDLKAKGRTIPPIVMRLRGTGEDEAREIVSVVCRVRLTGSSRKRPFQRSSISPI